MSTAAPSPAGSAAAPTQRLASLDALRGVDMFVIIGGGSVVQALVNACKSPAMSWIPERLAQVSPRLAPAWTQSLAPIPEQLKHVPWAGFHFIDLVFPLFLFMIGVAIPYSFAKRLARGDSLGRTYAHIVVRVAVMIVLGMMVNGNLLTYDPGKFDLTYSVLQMLALGYLVAALLYLNLNLAWQIVATIVMLVGYWALLAFVPGPHHEIGKFAPGCNAGDWVTEYLFGPWRGHQVGWVLGILGHASTAMLGVFAGQLLRSAQNAARKLAWLTVLGLFGLGAGLLWGGYLAAWYPDVELFGSNWTEWPVWFPIIKNRWTSSYALYAGGWSYLLLALFYLVIDVWGLRRWAVPFMAIGANSIFAYMAWQLGHSAFRRVSEVFLGGLKPYVGPWHEAILAAGTLATLWILLFYMYRKQTFVRI